VVDDPEGRPAGVAEPHYAVSSQVTVSRDHGLYVYHVADDQLGQGSSFGNARAWAETKGSGHMLNFFNIEAGTAVCGGMSLTYLIPFSDLSVSGAPATAHAAPAHDRFCARHAVRARGDPPPPGLSAARIRDRRWAADPEDERCYADRAQLRQLLHPRHSAARGHQRWMSRKARARQRT
jgi:hypothetical protein